MIQAGSRFDKYSALYLWALFMVVFGIAEGRTFLSGRRSRWCSSRT